MTRYPYEPEAPVDIFHRGVVHRRRLYDFDQRDGRALPRARVFLEGRWWVVAWRRGAWHVEVKFAHLVQYHRDHRERFGWPDLDPVRAR